MTSRHYHLWWYRMLGLKVGNSCILSRSSFGLEEIDLLEIGDGVFLGAMLQLHFRGEANGNVIYKKMKIGNNSWIGAWNSIAAGVTIGDGSEVGNHSYVT